VFTFFYTLIYFPSPILTNKPQPPAPPSQSGRKVYDANQMTEIGKIWKIGKIGKIWKIWKIWKLADWLTKTTGRRLLKCFFKKILFKKVKTFKKDFLKSIFW
jgi:hypothetical protein